MGLLGATARPFGGVGLLSLQIVIASMNLVAGILSITYYAIHVGPGGVPTAPGTLLPIALFVFIFGVLSFAVACLVAVPAFNTAVHEPETYDIERETFVPAYTPPPPQVVTRQYVVQRRQTIADQAWVKLACQNCSRIVSSEDNFCDQCGAQFQEVAERAEKS